MSVDGFCGGGTGRKYFKVKSICSSSRFVCQGERSFFLHPGEKLENGIQDIYILGEDEGLILKANETFKDASEEDEEVF